MLEVIVALDWLSTYAVAAEGALPNELREIAESRCAESAQTYSETPGQNPVLPLRLAWLYEPEGLLLLDSRCNYRAERDNLVLGPQDRDALERRCRQAGTEKPYAMWSEKTGIGTAATLPWLHSDLTERMGRGRPHFLPASRALRWGQSNPPAAGRLPDAAVFHSIDLPTELTLKLEPTTACNFNCGFCYGRHLSQSLLSLEDFLTILDRVPGLRAVELTGEGEPFLHKGIFDFIAECKQRGLWVHITTNGSLLTEDRIRRLLELKVDSLGVSLESIHPERFARVRPGGDLTEVVAAIENLERLRRQEGSALRTELWVAVLRETLPEQPALRRFAESMGFDDVWFQLLNPMPAYRRFYDPWLLSNLISPEQARALIADPATPPETVEALGIALWPYAGRRCEIFMHTVMVDRNAQLTPCCLLKAPTFPSLGDLRTHSLEDLWESPRFRRFRFALQHGIVLGACSHCPDVASA